MEARPNFVAIHEYHEQPCPKAVTRAEHVIALRKPRTGSVFRRITVDKQFPALWSVRPDGTAVVTLQRGLGTRDHTFTRWHIDGRREVLPSLVPRWHTVAGIRYLPGERLAVATRQGLGKRRTAHLYVLDISSAAHRRLLGHHKITPAKQRLVGPRMGAGMKGLKQHHLCLRDKNKKREDCSNAKKRYGPVERDYHVALSASRDDSHVALMAFWTLAVYDATERGLKLKWKLKDAAYRDRNYAIRMANVSVGPRGKFVIICGASLLSRVIAVGRGVVAELFDHGNIGSGWWDSSACAVDGSGRAFTSALGPTYVIEYDPRNRRQRRLRGERGEVAGRARLEQIVVDRGILFTESGGVMNLQDLATDRMLTVKLKER